MPGSKFVNETGYADARVSLEVAFTNRLEAMGPAPIMEAALQLPSSAALNKYKGLGDMPGMKTWTADRKIEKLSALSFQIENKSWEASFSIGKEEIDDGQLPLRIADATALADACRNHPAELVAKILINGFAGSLFDGLVGDGLCFDGSLFFSAAHSIDGGPAQDNLMSGAALTEANLEAAALKAANLKTYDGTRPLNITPTHLIVGPKMEATAVKLVGASMATNVAAGSNVYLSGRYKVIVNPFITGSYDDYWFLADLSKGSKPVILQNREPLKVEMSDEKAFMSRELLFGASARYNVGLYDWRTIIGANP